ACGGLPKAGHRHAMARRHRRLPLPGAGSHVVLRQQGRLSRRGPRSAREPGVRMNVDDVVLSFTPGSLTLLNIVLGLIMLGIALDTSPSDFRVVAKHPKPFIIAILAQLLLLPAVTFGLALILPVTASMAMGM